MHTSDTTITGQYLNRFQRLATSDGGADLLPVTGAQRRFVLVRAMDPAGRPDTVPMFFAFPRGTVDTGRLRAAAEHVAARHPALHSQTHVVRGTPVLRPGQPSVPLQEVLAAPGENARDALRRAVGAWSPDGPPLRLFLARDTSADEVLAVVLDHAACDGQSLARIVEDLGDAYLTRLGPGDATADEIAAGLAEYREAVLLQLEAERRASSPDALAYWGERLRTVGECAPRPPTGESRPTGSARLRLSADSFGVPFASLLDACRAAATVLYGAGQVPPIGYPWGGRPAGAPPVVGCFLNTVVFPAATDSVRPAPERTATQWWDDLDRADTPFDEVVHAARTAGSRWSGALDGLLTVDDAGRRPLLRLDGVTGREVDVDGRRIRAPFAVSVVQGPELDLRMVWDRAVLDDDRAQDAFAALAGALRTSLPVA
ncbi:non-ribosomal peptide synthetase [Streptomyces sp. NBC_00237]|uniref:non-ribosomal peptide synthetase n=1 Tax=Streptomyces sp. NBC_00237 TaxID=2975687 RepID=UPI002257AC53|nr:non-ribosomal peptide synthetase [Streptomyces sp. NBC_00237]MCX5206389.1 non-ribosomal peptide synthetase [Streptomyces sp. NBC_00237]